MNAISNIGGPNIISELENVVGSVVVIEDFQGQQQEFILVSCSPDIIKLEVCEGKYKGAKISIDLGTNSTIDARIKNILHGGKIVFGESNMKQENLENAKSKKTGFLVSEVIEEHREEFERRTVNLLALINPDTDKNGRDASTLELYDILRDQYIRDGIISDDL